jgi:hypothetical protein
MSSGIAIALIILVSFQIIVSDTNFAEASFYLKHNSAFFWATAWLFLFIYWHICAFKTYSEIKDDISRKTLLIYLLAIADVSFILSAFYVIIGYFFFSVNVCTDSPSIWCTFYVVQSFLIPILMFRLESAFNRADEPKKIALRQTIVYLTISLLILIALILTLTQFKCLTWKLAFP